MSQFPNYVAVNEPVPAKGSLEKGIRLKEANAKGDHRNRKKTGDKAIQDVGKQGDFILRMRIASVKKPSDNLDQQQYRNNGSQKSLNTVLRQQGFVILCSNNIQ